MRMMLQMFGGRGASSGASGTGGGTFNAITPSNVKDLSDSKLEGLEEDLRRQYEEANGLLLKIASENRPDAMPRNYYDVKNVQTKAWDALNVVLDEKRNRRKQPSAPLQRGYVPKREITSLTYKRAMARLKKDMDAWFKGRR